MRLRLCKKPTNLYHTIPRSSPNAVLFADAFTGTEMKFIAPLIAFLCLSVMLSACADEDVACDIDEICVDPDYGNDAGDSSDANEHSDADDNGGEQGRVGLEGFCDHYKDCGGTYYSDAQDCIDASINYWGECRRPELDDFGNCMMNVDCDDWNPDTYNPAGTVCSEQWSDVTGADC